MSKHSKIILKNTNEHEMTSTIELEHQNKTSVNWGFKPEKVEYIGKVNIKDLEDKEKEE